MVNDKEALKKTFDRFVTQQAREQECHDDEVRDVIYEYLLNGSINNITSGSSV